MSRNVNSFFSENPVTMDMSRSKFERNQNIKTTLNAGSLVPFYIDEVLPGDSMSVDTSQVIRMSTLISPIMDNIYCDTYYFFVPNRLVWEHWKNFMGENTASAWIPTVSYSIPQLYVGQSGWGTDSVADYYGIPTKVGPLSINALPFRAYGLIYNEWFRDENLTNPLYVPVNDAQQSGNFADPVRGGTPALSAKYHDYFTSCLPAPQKGPDVPLPLGNVAPVITGNSIASSYFPMAQGVQVLQQNGQNISVNPHNLVTALDNDNIGRLNYDSDTYTASGTLSSNLVFGNLYTDLSAATGTSINQLREAFQVQKLYEKDALGGTRYTEIIKAHFGVSSPDARLQRPEYLGGCRVPINIHQVVQNSATDSVTPQGNTAAYSLTINSHSDFTKSFTEHGMIIGLMCIRYQHSYQQGLERFWSRKLREDFYFPVFANLGNQQVKNKEVFVQGSSVLNPVTNVPYDEEVFGYQEAWAEYRYKPDRISGQFRSNATGTLDFWHLGDYYTQLPVLSDAWIKEDMSNIDRTLAVTSSVSNQFIADIYVKNTSVRPMPLYSVPGLIDHH